MLGLKRWRFEEDAGKPAGLTRVQRRNDSAAAATDARRVHEPFAISRFPSGATQMRCVSGIRRLARMFHTARAGSRRDCAWFGVSGASRPVATAAKRDHAGVQSVRRGRLPEPLLQVIQSMIGRWCEVTGLGACRTLVGRAANPSARSTIRRFLTHSAAMGLQIAENLSSRSRVFASTTKARQAPRPSSPSEVASLLRRRAARSASAARSARQ